MALGTAIATFLPAGSPPAGAAAASGTSWQAAVARATQIPCSDSAAPAAGVTIPVGIPGAGPSVWPVIVGVCIDGQGPFPFAVDTGAPTSYVSRGLSNDLKLASRSPLFSLGVVGCASSRSRLVAVTSWSVEGIGLDAQQLTAGPLGSPGPGLQLDGLLGSDVLARFGAVRIDYRAQTLSTAQVESTTTAPAALPMSGPVTTFDTASGVVQDVGMHVYADQFLVRPVTSLTIRRKPRRFIVDTGAAEVAVGPKLARYVQLKPIWSEKLSALNCGEEVHAYVGGANWKLGTMSIGEQLVGGVPQAGANYGLLGSPVLSSAGALVVDFADGRLLLTRSSAPN